MVQPDVARTLPVGTLVAGKYRIVSEIGRGGMGAVYLAQHVGLGQKVALKVLSPGQEENHVRFVREARAAARLQSEHVVRVTDVGTSDGIGPYMVMEYLSGTDLGRLVDAHGPMPVAQAVDAILQIADGLAEAHALGIVHRDLKPQNVFLAERADGSTIVKVLDFGISKMNPFDDEALKLTETRALIGSPHYMSPEQLRSARDVDARADVWSVGVVLYELLTGTTPFTGHTVGAVFSSVLEATPTSVRARRPDVPPVVEAAIQRCMQRDPAHRFQYIAELARELAPYGSGAQAGAVERAASFTTAVQTRGPSASGIVQVGSAGATPHPRIASGRAAWTPAPVPTSPPSGGRAAVAIALVVAAAAVVGGTLLTLRARARPHAAPGASVVPTYDDMSPPATPTLTADPPNTGANIAPASAAPSLAPAPRPHPSARPSAAASAPPPPPPAPVPSADQPDLDRRR